eukprot:10891224-Alexandrium_andersonii.AAC.1
MEAWCEARRPPARSAESSGSPTSPDSESWTRPSRPWACLGRSPIRVELRRLVKLNQLGRPP